MSRFTGISEKSVFLKQILNMGEVVWAVDAIALNFMKKLDSIDCSIWVLKRLDF